MHAPVVQAVLVGEAMLMALILFVPAPEVLMVEAIFNPLVVVAPVVFVDASVKLKDARLPVSAAVCTYVAEDTDRADPVVMAVPAEMPRPVPVVKEFSVREKTVPVAVVEVKENVPDA